RPQTHRLPTRKLTQRISRHPTQLSRRPQPVPLDHTYNVVLNLPNRPPRPGSHYLDPISLFLEVFVVDMLRAGDFMDAIELLDLATSVWAISRTAFSEPVQANFINSTAHL